MPINPLDRIQAHYDSFTKTDMEIAVYILNNPRESARSSADELAEITHSSKPALVRFAKKIGYNGYAEFRFDLSRLLVSENKHSSDNYEDIDSPLVSITKTYSSYILDIQNTITMEQVNKVAELILSSKRVKIVGHNRTFNSALNLKQRLGRIGVDCEAISDDVTLRDFVDMANSDDVIIVYTIQDNVHSFNTYLSNAHSRNCKYIVVTMHNNLSFKKNATEYLVLPRISYDSSISFLDDQAIYMVFNEILLNCVATKMNE